MKKYFIISYLKRVLCWFRLTSRPHLLAGIVFVLLTVGMTWPLVTRLNTHITPGQQPAMAVPYLNLWTLAWNHQWLLGEVPSYWDANLFYPHQKTLAYSEPQLATGVLTAPLAFLGSNTILAYNIALLGFFSGAGMAAYALCWWLLGISKGDPKNQTTTRKVFERYRWLSAIVAGILYGFNFYMFREAGVLQLLATLFLPLTFLGIHRFFHGRRWCDALLFSIGFIGSWYTCAYYGIFLSIFVPCFVIRLGGRDLLSREILVKAAVTLTFLLVCLMPLVYGMWSAKRVMGLDRPEFVVRDLSAVFKEYLKLPHQGWFYSSILGVGPGQSLFLGGALLCLAGLGVVAIFRAKDNKTFAINEQTQSPLQRYGVFYLFMALFAFLLSLGMALTPRPSIDLGVYQILVWLSPYNLLYKFMPGFSSIRSPHRFYIFVVLFLAVLAGYGIFWLSQRVRPEWRRILVPLMIVVAISELWPLPLRLVKVPCNIEELPGIYQHVRKLPAESVLLELPIVIGESERELEEDARSMYLSTFHGHSLVNGYSGFTPQAHFELVTEVLTSTPQAVFSGLKAFGVQYVLVHDDELTKSGKAQLRDLEAEGLNLISRKGNDSLYQVDYGVLEEFDPLLDIAEMDIYENQTSGGYVNLCFHYQIVDPHCILITPWQNQIEFEIEWYKWSELKKAGGQPVLVSQVPYRGSKLITAASNVIEIKLPAPPPGEYQIIVRQHSALNSNERTLLCQIHENGFVTSQGEM